MKKERYVAALSYRWLDRLYDPLVRLTMPERKFKTCLIEQAELQPNLRVLDLGCGTATLSLLMKELNPGVRSFGLDGDLRILRLAGRKMTSKTIRLHLIKGFASALPFHAGVFDRILSSLMFHHLSSETKTKSLKECYRVLRPGGEIHIADWGKPSNLLMKMAFLMIRWLDSLETTEDDFRGRMPQLMEQAGFIEVQEVKFFNTIFGTLWLYRGKK